MNLCKILLVCVLVTACSSTGSAGTERLPTATADMRDVVISLERTRCFGGCPVYSVTIRGDGSVTYVGEMFVKAQGTRTTRLSQDQVQELVAEFERIDYFGLDGRYTDSDISDSPSAITSITWGERSKTVRHYAGDKSAPPELDALEQKIDEVANTRQWIKGP